MSDQPLLMRTGVLTGYADECRRRGVDPLAIVRELGLPREVLSNADLYIRREQMGAMLEAAASECGDPAFTMDLVDRQDASALGALGYLIFQGATVREGIQLVAECVGYHIQGLKVAVRDLEHERSVVEIDFGLPPEVRFRQAAEMGFARNILLLQSLLGDAFAPIECWFTYPAPDDGTRYEARVEVPIRWSQPTVGYVFASESLELPPQQQPSMKTFLVEFVQQSVMPEEEDFAAKTRTVVRSLIGQSCATLETVSAAMGMHTRDLQRQLKTSGEPFRALRDAVHLQYARDALSQPDVSMTVLALELGYSESSAFSRAFKNWTGSSPTVWRKEMLAGTLQG